MNSFITWIGGKKLLRNKIVEMFPKSDIDRYIEVFGGVGWVLFHKDQHAKLEVFNDVNSNLINLYRCVKYHCEELQKELDWILISRETFFDYKQQIDTRGLTDIQRAARFFFIIKASYGADVRSFGCSKRNLNKSIEYLSEIKERLKNTVIENKDFQDLIKVYDREKALFYLDPPYHTTEKYYDNKFTNDDHKRLSEALKNIKGKFVISYNDDGFVRELYKDFNIYPITRNNSLSTKQKNFDELIITNY
ncbi:MAG: DNA adenine methylase [Bacillales bacterium]|nr:DNA adenine methylase [Bacillales bacterium]